MQVRDLAKLTNGELSRKLTEYNNEYEVKKNQIIQLVKRLEELDRLYIEVEKEINNRKQGFVNDGNYTN